MSPYRALIAALLAGAALGPATLASADVKAGVEAWERGDYARAVAEWKLDAARGDADAQFNLAQAYKLGRGVPADLQQAENLYRLAAERGHIQAADNYGIILFTGGKKAEAIPWLEKSAARGEPRAQYLLGTATFNGDEVTRDQLRGYALVSRASQAGLAPAAKGLAEMDRFLSPSERARGAAMAEEMAMSERNERLALMDLPARPTPPAPAAVKPATLPPSQAGTSYTPSPTPGDLADAPPPPVVRATPTPAPAPAREPAARSGKWRIQLGAFSSRGNAESLWARLAKRGDMAGLQPYYEAAGKLTRIKAGPFATRAEAERTCQALKASGQGCFPVGS